MILKKSLQIIHITSKNADGNMSIFCGDTNQALKNKAEFLKKLNINSKNAIELKQVHGNKIVIVKEPSSKIQEADGMITNTPNVFLMIKAADCHQIAFFDPKNNAIGLIHAGYKGLAKGIIRNTITALKKNYHTNPKDLIIKFGPSIGPCCYRVDIWKEAEDQLSEFGILKENIYNPRICTYENIDYFSHRRSEDTKTSEARFVTIFALNYDN